MRSALNPAACGAQLIACSQRQPRRRSLCHADMIAAGILSTRHLAGIPRRSCSQPRCASGGRYNARCHCCHHWRQSLRLTDCRQWLHAYMLPSQFREATIQLRASALCFALLPLQHCAGAHTATGQRGGLRSPQLVLPVKDAACAQLVCPSYVWSSDGTLALRSYWVCLATGVGV
jgi:hypothetical protein